MRQIYCPLKQVQTSGRPLKRLNLDERKKADSTSGKRRLEEWTGMVIFEHAVLY